MPIFWNVIKLIFFGRFSGVLTGYSCRAKDLAGGMSFFTLQEGLPTFCSSYFPHSLYLRSSNVLPKNKGEKNDIHLVKFYVPYPPISNDGFQPFIYYTSPANRVEKWAFSYQFRQTSLKQLICSPGEMGATDCLITTQKYVSVHLLLSQIHW